MTVWLPMFTDPVDNSSMTRHDHLRMAGAIARAAGVELRECRERRGWTQSQFADRLPSGIGQEMVARYELYKRPLHVVRWVEMCVVVGVSPGMLLDRALHRARLALDTVIVRVDLPRLLASTDESLRPLMLWARTRLDGCPDGVVELHPLAVRELAAAVGFEVESLVSKLAEFPAVPPMT